MSVYSQYLCCELYVIGRPLIKDTLMEQIGGSVVVKIIFAHITKSMNYPVPKLFDCAVLWLKNMWFVCFMRLIKSLEIITRAKKLLIHGVSDLLNYVSMPLVCLFIFPIKCQFILLDPKFNQHYLNYQIFSHLYIATTVI